MKIALIVPTIWEFEPFLKDLALTRTTNRPFLTYDRKLGAIDLRVVISYIGPSNSAAAAQYAISSHCSQALFLSGAAGGVTLDHLPGDIIIGSQCTTLASKEVIAARRTLALPPSLIRYMLDGQAIHNQFVETDPRLLSALTQAAEAELQLLPKWTSTPWPEGLDWRPAKVAKGRLGSVDWWTRDPKQLQFFNEQFGVTVEDMESS